MDSPATRLPVPVANEVDKHYDEGAAGFKRSLFEKMRAACGLFIVYAVLDLLILCVAVGIGFLLHWMIPSIDVGTGILAGTASTIASGYFFVQLANMAAVSEPVFEKEADDEEEVDDEEEELSYVPLAAFRPRHKRRRKKRR